MKQHLARTAVAVTVSFGFATGCASGNAGTSIPQNTGVTAEDLERSTDPIEHILQMRVSGLTVIRTNDGGIALQIRGAHSYDGSSNAPLFLLDGAPFEPGPMGALSGINPLNIASIRVLKGADAGIYGIQGSNGVILITTKRAGNNK